MNFKGSEMATHMDRLLMIQIHEKQMYGVSVSSEFICNITTEISEDLKHKSPQSSGSQVEEFKAI
jgi:hypothetical protein